MKPSEADQEPISYQLKSLAVGTGLAIVNSPLETIDKVFVVNMMNFFLVVVVATAVVPVYHYGSPLFYLSSLGTRLLVIVAIVTAAVMIVFF